MQGRNDRQPEKGLEQTAILTLGDMRQDGVAPAKSRHLLVMVQGSALGQVFPLGGLPCRIGRHEDSEIILTDSGISRRHARIEFDGTGYVIEDLESANGTFVQGERIAKRRLNDGDLLQFGSGVAARYSITDADHEAMLRHLYEASITDPLTRTYNRDHFEVRLRGELSYARRHRTELSLILFDVDHFKRVNDTYGHQAGDAVLSEMAARILRGLRAEDVFARYGGEEFAIILREIDIEGARVVGERLRALVKAMDVVHGDQNVRVTVSVGCSALAEARTSEGSALIALADRRLYAAKRGGRDRVVHAD